MASWLRRPAEEKAIHEATLKWFNIRANDKWLIIYDNMDAKLESDEEIRFENIDVKSGSDDLMMLNKFMPRKDHIYYYYD